MENTDWVNLRKLKMWKPVRLFEGSENVLENSENFPEKPEKLENVLDV